MKNTLWLLIAIVGACAPADDPNAIHFDRDGVHIDVQYDLDRAQTTILDDEGRTLVQDAIRFDTRVDSVDAADLRASLVPSETAEGEARPLAAPACSYLGNGWDYCADGDGWCLSQGPSACGHDWTCCGWNGDCTSRDEQCW